MPGALDIPFGTIMANHDGRVLYVTRRSHQPPTYPAVNSTLFVGVWLTPFMEEEEGRIGEVIECFSLLHWSPEKSDEIR